MVPGRWSRLPLFSVLLFASSAAFAQPTGAQCVFPAAAAGGPVNAHTRFVEQNLLPAIVEADTKPFALADRMRAYSVPGVSVAVVHDGRLDWARGWGVRDTESCAPVTPDTDFQAASISKLVTAVAALRLVERGKLDLDVDIDRILTTWHLPREAKFASQPVTLRQLLSHTAGVNVHGFPGYPKGSAVPTAVQVLQGVQPAVTEGVKVMLPPGQQWQYSGGGYVIAQVAMADAAGMPFPALMEREVLGPLGMRRSAYAQPPSATVTRNVALGHADGKVIAGGYHVYPELGPAGLWTTPTDLAQVLLDLQASASGRPSRLLSPRMTAQMLAPVKGGWGLGPALYGSGAALRFGHDGVNEGFQSTMVGYAARGEGVIVMTNGAGKRLADEIVRAIATDYGWTDLAAKPIVEAHLAHDTLAHLTGRYEGSGMSVYLDLREGHLFVQTGGPDPERLIALSSTRFKTQLSGIVIDFHSGPGFTIIEGGPPIALERVAAGTADSSDAPLFLRGSMNGWGAGAPLTKAPDGSIAVELPLAAGEYQFKIASEDWKAADFGATGSAPIAGVIADLPLVPHGANLRLAVSTPGIYRFVMKRAGSAPKMSIARVSP
jgi:CubicO group peptidase (beta-lactamase class C family)